MFGKQQCNFAIHNPNPVVRTDQDITPAESTRHKGLRRKFYQSQLFQVIKRKSGTASRPALSCPRAPIRAEKLHIRGIRSCQCVSK
jgi:hypothetical protein